MESGVAVIKVNDVEVGSMPVEQYEKLVAEVKRDRRTQIASVVRYAGFIWRFFCRFCSYYIQSFSVIITVFLLLSMFQPQEVTDFISSWQGASAESITGLINTIARYCLVITVASFILSIFIKGVPVFVSATEDAINRKIREVMEVPANGKVSVVIMYSGALSVKTGTRELEK